MMTTFRPENVKVRSYTQPGAGPCLSTYMRNSYCKKGYSKRNTPPVPQLSELRPPSLTTTDCGVAGCGDPIRGAISPHAQHAVVDCRMINLLDLGYALPRGVKPAKPDLVYVL